MNEFLIKNKQKYEQRNYNGYNENDYTVILILMLIKVVKTMGITLKI